MKKTFAFVMLTLFCLAGLQAQSSLSLESVCASLAARPNTTGDFIQIKTINANGRQLKSSGKFIISTIGIMWKTEKPFPSSLILTKDSMIQIAANGNKSVMDGKDNQIFANISDTLTSVFSGNSKGGWTLELRPKDSTIASVMERLVLSGALENGAAVLGKLEMAETSGNKIIYEFTNQKYPEELSADEKQNFIAE